MIGKLCQVVQKTRPIGEQLQVLNLPGGGASSGRESVYESLHAYIHNAISPYFNAFVSVKDVAAENNGKTRDDKDSKMGFYRELPLILIRSCKEEVCRTGTVIASSPAKY